MSNRKQINKNLLRISLFFLSMHLQAEFSDKDLIQMLSSMNTCRMKPLAGFHPDDVCEFAQQIIKAREEERSFPNTLILYGSPGTGKTELARAISVKAHAEFLSISAGSIVTSLQGSGAAAIRAAFEKAHAYAADKKSVVIFIDEIDAFCKTRSDNTHHQDLENTLNELNVQVSKIKKSSYIAVVVATNKEESLDSAFLNRFDRVEIPLPNPGNCKAIFESCASKYTHDLYDEFNRLAYHAYEAKFSGRDIERLIDRAFVKSTEYGFGGINTAVVYFLLKEHKIKKAKELQKEEDKKREEQQEKDIKRLQHEEMVYHNEMNKKDVVERWMLYIWHFIYGRE